MKEHAKIRHDIWVIVDWTGDIQADWFRTAESAAEFVAAEEIEEYCGPVRITRLEEMRDRANPRIARAPRTKRMGKVGKRATKP